MTSCVCCSDLHSTIYVCISFYRCIGSPVGSEFLSTGLVLMMGPDTGDVLSMVIHRTVPMTKPEATPKLRHLPPELARVKSQKANVLKPSHLAKKTKPSHHKKAPTKCFVAEAKKSYSACGIPTDVLAMHSARVVFPVAPLQSPPKPIATSHLAKPMKRPAAKPKSPATMSLTNVVARPQQNGALMLFQFLITLFSFHKFSNYQASSCNAVAQRPKQRHWQRQSHQSMAKQVALFLFL